MKKHIIMSFDIDSETALITNCKVDQVTEHDRLGNVRLNGIMSADEISINNVCEELGKTLTYDVLDATEY